MSSLSATLTLKLATDRLARQDCVRSQNGPQTEQLRIIVYKRFVCARKNRLKVTITLLFMSFIYLVSYIL